MADTIPVTLYLDSETKDRLDALRADGYTLNGFIRAAIDEHLKRIAPPPTTTEDLSRLVSRG